jgi:hypothetical protein
MRLSERCSCGAKFEVEHRNAVALVREWRKGHVCEFREELRDSALDTKLELSTTTDESEFKIGFQYTETEEYEDK